MGPATPEHRCALVRFLLVSVPCTVRRHCFAAISGRRHGSINDPRAHAREPRLYGGPQSPAISRVCRCGYTLRQLSDHRGLHASESSFDNLSKYSSFLSTVEFFSTPFRGKNYYSKPTFLISPTFCPLSFSLANIVITIIITNVLSQQLFLLVCRGDGGKCAFY